MTVTINGTTGITSPSDSLSGNLTFTGTGNRITGDFSNVTAANRVSFQSSTTNGASIVQVLPNGTATTSGFIVSQTSDTTGTGGYGFLYSTSAEFRLTSGVWSGSSYLPMTFHTGGSERMRIDTSGNVGIGTSSPSYKLDISGSNPRIRVSPTTGTDYAFFQAGNTGGNAFIGLENSAGSALSTGAPYALAMYHGGAYPIVFCTSAAERARIDSAGQMYTTNGAGSVAKAYDCRAWVNFNGTGTVAIRASGNVTSITDNGTGDYTVNFTTAMSDANYSVVGNSRNSTTRANVVIPSFSTATPLLTGSARINSISLSSVLEDPDIASISVFR